MPVRSSVQDRATHGKSCEAFSKTIGVKRPVGVALPPLSRGCGGCNILIENISEQGRISIVSNGKIIEASQIVANISLNNRLVIKDINRVVE